MNPRCAPTVAGETQSRSLLPPPVVPLECMKRNPGFELAPLPLATLTALAAVNKMPGF